MISGAFEREALVQYHQQANPVLRRAVALTTAIRDRHFEFARQAVAGARDEAAAARRAVLLITLAALGIAVAVAWHLTRTVVGPVRRLTRGANAIREGQFAERIDVASRDELGELASAFNQMAEDLAEFRRTNVSEVVRAKNTLEATLEALPDAVVLLDAGGADPVDESGRARARWRRRVCANHGASTISDSTDWTWRPWREPSPTGSRCRAAGRPDPDDPRRTGRHRPAAAAARGVRCRR